MKITKSEITVLLSKIAEKLENELEDNITLKTDVYKLIPTEEWDDFSKTDFDTHSLIDDIIELKKLINEKDRPITYVDLDRIASLLREISQLKNPI